jgi:HEAT repeat protein
MRRSVLLEIRSLHSRLDRRAVLRLTELLRNGDAAVREAAATEMRFRTQGPVKEALQSALRDRSPLVRRAAAESLGVNCRGSRRAPSMLIRLLRDPHPIVRLEATESLGYIGDRRVLPKIWAAARGGHPLVRSYAAAAIGGLGRGPDRHRLERALKTESSNTARIGFYDALYRLGDKDRLFDIVALLRTQDYRVRCAAARTLSHFVNRTNRGLILSALRLALASDHSMPAKEAFREGLRKIGSAGTSSRLSVKAAKSSPPRRPRHRVKMTG